MGLLKNLRFFNYEFCFSDCRPKFALQTTKHRVRGRHNFPNGKLVKITLPQGFYRGGFSYECCSECKSVQQDAGNYADAFKGT